MDPVVHFEMPYEDAGRVSDFYKKTFGWSMNTLGGEMGEYVLAQTDETDDKGMLKKTNRINGGFFKVKDSPVKHPSVVIAVKDLPASMQKVKDGGGKVLIEPMDIPGIGRYVSITDTEGNIVGMLQPASPM